MKTQLSKNLTREEWLQIAVEKVTPIFNEKGYQVPKVKVSCGFASTGKDRHVGQCWASYASDAKVNEIFISPGLDDAVNVLDTLIHELVHAVDDCKHGHGKEFKEIALSVGLEGKMRQASAGEKLRERLAVMATELDKYPHLKLKFHKKKRAYKVGPKAKCKTCGYQLNVPKKWLHYGAPNCPLHGTKMDEVGNWDEE
jgi:hypothetical protein